jgi:hypothetical protein
VVRQRLSISDRKYPVTCGIDDFEMIEEAYDNRGLESEQTAAR